MIALIVAGLVLVAVGGRSYSNYLRSQYEDEYGVLPKHQQVDVTNSDFSAQEMGLQGGGNVVTSTLDPGATQPLVATSPAYRTESIPPAQGPRGGAQASGVGGARPAPADAESAKLQARLKALERESALLQKKFDQVRSGRTPVANPANPAGASRPRATAAESGSLREVMAREGNGTGASPALFPKGGASSAAQRGEKDEYKRQIAGAPVVGKVVEFNAKWGFVEIDAGKNRNISNGTKFAVRRGTMIVGYVKVEEVTENTAIAELTSRNEFSETALKPKTGDDIINWPLF